jgi:hypothetical protein
MTVATDISTSGPYAGAGTTGPFLVDFRFLSSSHLQVIKTSTLGIDSTLVLSTDYSVAGVGAPTGSVTLVAALAVGEQLTIIRDVPLTQEADYVQNSDFPAESHEAALDKLTMITQQLAEAQGRSLTLPATSPDGVSTELPLPEANKLIGWNETETGLQNFDPSTLATIIAFGTANSDLFSGTGAQTVFVLSANPGALNNLDVAISGVTQRPGIDYTWSGGTTLTFAVAPPLGTNNVLARYMQALPTADSELRQDLANPAAGFGDALIVSKQPFTGTAVRTQHDKNAEVLSIRDFGGVGDGATDCTTAFQSAINAGVDIYLPKGIWRITSALNFGTLCVYVAAATTH